MAITATIDRFEGELAVLLEDKEGGEGTRVNVERALLPEEAREGDVIALSGSLGGGESETVRQALSGARVDRQAADQRSERARERIHRLKKRGERGRESR